MHGYARDGGIAQIAKAAIRGNQKAVAELCGKKMENMYFIAYGLLGNTDDAKDAAQESALRICHSIGGLKDPAAVESWIMKIVHNVCYQMLRKAKRVKDTVYMEGGAPQAGDDTAILQITDDDRDFMPEQYTEDAESRGELMDAVMSLGEKQREVVLMFYYSDMSVKEIADITETNVNTVTSNLTRARAMIKRRLMEKESRAESAAITVALQAVSAEMFTPELQAELTSQVRAAIVPAHGTAAPGAMAAKFVAVFVAGFVTAFTIGIGVNMQYGASASFEQTEADVVSLYGDGDGEISFVGGECECGHRNPGSAQFTEKAAAATAVSWEITDMQTGRTLHVGTGRSVPDGLSALVDEGWYLISFHIVDTDGNDYNAQRAFEVR
ncbi:MAG: sigma-70 family RNA polymerase sigma factor [Clostridiales Family XIII bacterium]|jgi:RNA polymerase sigma-70 factor (ECF subfamily)|nr:sigma-70 family RNA polymerase sigma factor [Clostridiales Family XIII bacterium]